MKTHTAAKPDGPPEWLIEVIGVPLGTAIVALVLYLVYRRLKFFFTHGRHYRKMQRSLVKRQRYDS